MHDGAGHGPNAALAPPAAARRSRKTGRGTLAPRAKTASWVAILAVFGAACSSDFPRLRIYQVEEAVDIVEGQAGERFRDHRDCVRERPELAALLACMDGKAYRFVARGPEYPAAECWQLRDRGGADLPPAYCFERK